MRTRTSFLSLAFMILGGSLHADPPARVARLGYFTGSVSFRPASLDEWAPATANYPLTEGDHLWTDDDGRGELHVGGSAVVRLAPSTAFSFLGLDDDTAQMRISEGRVAVTVRDLDRDEEVEVDTPDAAVSFLREGFYVVEVGRDGYQTIVTVRRGEAEVTAGGAAVTVHSGDALVIEGGDSPRYDVRDAYGPSDWEEWCLERDHRYGGSESRRYVSTRMIGYQDLDYHGSWRHDHDYGYVWVPTTVAVSWAPYRYGRWVYVHPWGWTWVDDAPWGFAPFHYGRWAYRPWGWCWIPGAIVARPVYAPALVVFVGGDVFSGGLGWFPLGPREIYVPPYAVSSNYIRNVNVTHVTNITQINVTQINVTNINYVNRRVNGAVTVVDRDTFVGGRPVARGTLSVSSREMARARVRTTLASAMRPRRESYLGSVETAAVRRPPVRVQERAVVTRVKPERRVRPDVAGGPGRRNTLVKPAAEEGRGVRLSPAREGLPEARAVRPGQRPRSIVRDAAPAIRTPRRTLDDRGREPYTEERPTPRATPEERARERGTDVSPPFRPAERPTPRRTLEDRGREPYTEERPTPRATPQDRPRERGTDTAPPFRPADRPSPRATRPSERPGPGSVSPPFRPPDYVPSPSMSKEGWESGDRPGASGDRPQRKPSSTPAHEPGKARGKQVKPTPTPSPEAKQGGR